jgi:SepF-like predicted cell division protein (DUF552 family)
LPIIGLFRKQKKQETAQRVTASHDSVSPDTSSSTVENDPSAKIYLKALPLRELSDLEAIKTEVRNGNVLILRITPLATKSIEEVKTAVSELYAFAESTGGDIARLGEERIVVCPEKVRIWREKPQVSNEPLPTAA